MSQQEDSRKIIENLKNDGCMSRKDADRCLYHKGDKQVTENVLAHYKWAYPEDES